MMRNAVLAHDHHCTQTGSAFSGLEICVAQTRGVAPGCHIMGFQPWPKVTQQHPKWRGNEAAAFSLIPLPMIPLP